MINKITWTKGNELPEYNENVSHVLVKIGDGNIYTLSQLSTETYYDVENKQQYKQLEQERCLYYGVNPSAPRSLIANSVSDNLFSWKVNTDYDHVLLADLGLNFSNIIDWRGEVFWLLKRKAEDSLEYMIDEQFIDWENDHHTSYYLKYKKHYEITEWAIIEQ